ncbi:MAG: class I SAM-dependent methyltransferase [Herpetosiphonaceae bacterium]|nr:class I SAM-dependent methyltransferase [Herpetosiphonaceae bacterium]
MDLKTHWETIYATKEPTEVSWYQPIPQASLDLIALTGVATTAPIIDVGGGTSTLVDQLLQRGYEHLTVLDISGSALRQAQVHLSALASSVTWIEDDITQITLPPATYSVWHDRAVFHFLTSTADRARYLQAVQHALAPGGYVIVGTFALDGPEECSNRTVMRYSAGSLHAAFGPSFELLTTRQELHPTPWGTTQSFVYTLMRAGDDRSAVDSLLQP